MFERIHLFLLRFVPSPVLRLFEGFWATPLALSILGIGLAALVQFAPPEWVGAKWTRYFEGIDVDGSKTALSVIAGSMVSLVTLVFSLTFVALSITAQQLSPRILDFVMREGTAQALLGLALSTLLYAAITLSMGDVRGAWRLGMAMPPALTLGAASLVMVVLFAHRMTRVMRAEELVARLGDQFVKDIHLLMKPPAGCRAAEEDPAAFARAFDEAGTILASRAGYVGVIDYAELLQWARKRDLKVDLKVRESEFLLPGVPVARVLGLHEGEKPPVEEIEQVLNLTDRREATHTASYEAAALSEAALRALSPGINDPATAISCLNRIFEGLAALATGNPVPRVLIDGHEDSKGVARLLRPSRTVSDFMALSVDPIVEAARNNSRTLHRIRDLAAQLRQITAAPRDRETIDALIERVEAALGE